MPSFVANGNIAPSRFVKQDTTAEGKCLQSGAGDPCFGISQQGTRRPPLEGWDDGFAAIAGENIHVFTEHDCDFCYLQIGSGGSTVGDYLKSDASGNGITTTTETDNAGAIAMETVAEGKLCKVRPRSRKHL